VISQTYHGTSTGQRAYPTHFERCKVLAGYAVIAGVFAEKIRDLLPLRRLKGQRIPKVRA